MGEDTKETRPGHNRNGTYVNAEVMLHASEWSKSNPNGVPALRGEVDTYCTPNPEAITRDNFL